MFAGWNSGGYGNLTKIRHNATYSTNYAHQSRIIVKYGQKVVQGEIIGYVGSTGLSTGPHLHYEMVKYGTKIDARYEVLPPGEAIKEENMSRYYSDIENYKNQLN
jgi:murein DD-endopeptidase MepM/ murein hydrolase activator NlpD